MNLTKLEKLYELKETGVITQEEYETQKNLLLNKDTPSAPKKMISPTEAYITYWKKYFVWNDRSTRAEFWWPVLFNFLILILLSGLIFFVSVSVLLIILFELATLIPGISVLVRRVRDVGLSKWIALVPVIFVFALTGFSVTGAVVDYIGYVNPLFNTVRSVIFVLGGNVLMISFFVLLVICCTPSAKQVDKYGISH